MLTYIKEVITRECHKEELEIPDSWGMFTSAGNRSLTKKAQTLVRKLEKIIDESDYPWGNSTKKENAILAYFRSYRRMCDSKQFSEASDTAVRECVWCFGEKVAKCIGMDWDALGNLWEKAR